MPAFFHPRLLVFDVVTGDTDLDETADQVSDVRISAMTGVGIGDDERPIIQFGGGGPLFRLHARARKKLVPVRRYESADDTCSLVGHLAERVAGEIRARVLRNAPLG